MDFRLVLSVSVVLVLVGEGCFGASLLKRRSVDPPVPIDDDSNIKCVLELMSIVTSPNAQALSEECEQMAKELTDDEPAVVESKRSPYSDPDVTSPDDDKEMREILESLLDSPSSEDSDVETRGVNEGPNERKMSESALDFLLDGGQDDDDDDSSLLNQLVSEDDSNMEFGQPFLTSVKGLDDKFLIIPMHVQSDEDAPAENPNVIEARSDPYEFDKFADADEEDEDLSDLLDPEEKKQILLDNIVDAVEEDGLADTDAGLNELAKIIAEIDPKAVDKKDLEEDDGDDEEEALYEIEMDLAKLKHDIAGIKRP